MEAERPAQRKAPVRVYTRAGWIEGTLHVPEKQPLLDFLNAGQDFYTMTDVRLASGTKLSFLALARSGILFVEPTTEEMVETVQRTSTRTKLRQVSCLFDGGMVMGTLAMPSELRVSDELMQSQAFVVLGNCTIGVDGGLSPRMEAAVTVLFQTSQLVAVAEMA